MYLWNIRPNHSNKTRGFVAKNLIAAFALARNEWPRANVLYCESANCETKFNFPATMTYQR